MDFKPLLLVFILVVQSTSQVPEVNTLYTTGAGYTEYFPLDENLVDGNTLRISVRGSRDAHILLATSPERGEPEYEIVLGALDNTVNYIRGRNPSDKEPNSAVRTVNLLNIQEERNIWIRLKRDSKNTSVTIQVGIGDEVEPFQKWHDKMPLNPLFLSFRSESWANWKYGFVNAANTIAVPRHRKLAIITSNENESTRYGQYHSLSEIMSHSNDTSATFYFTVEAEQEFLIILSPTTNPSEDRYEFGLKPTSVYLRRQEALVKEVNITDDCSGKQQYWIKLNQDGQIMLGKGGSEDPILSWLDPNPIFPQFLSFALIKGEDNSDPINCAEIEYGLGPDYTLDSQDCTPRWKNASNQQLPPGAVKGGYDKREELFICRAGVTWKKIWMPASVVTGDQNKKECHIPYGLKIEKKTDFQVLTGCGFQWVAETLGGRPEGAISASEPGETRPEYVARAYHKDQLIVGKFGTEANTIYYAADGDELSFTDYEVLIQPKKN